MAQKNVEYVVGLRDNFTQKMNRMDKTTNRFNRSIGSTIGRFATIAAVGGILVNATKKIADFEEGVSNLSAITGAVGKDLDFLKGKAIEMGKATTKTSIDTLTAFKLIASAKPELLTNAKALAATTKEAIALSEASGLDLPTAATALTGALNQFNLGAEESSRLINVLAAGAKFAGAEIPDLSTSMLEFGGIANSMGLSFEQAAASAEAISGQLKGSRAGMQLRNVFLKLASATDKNLNPSIVGLNTALENLAPIQDDVSALTKMFGRQNVIAAQTLIQQRKRVDELTTAMTGTNIAYEQQRINTDNLNSDVKRLNSAWEGFVLNLNKGEGAISSFLRRTVKGTTVLIDWFDTINTSAESLGKQKGESLFSKMFIGNETDAEKKKIVNEQIAFYEDALKTWKAKKPSAKSGAAFFVRQKEIDTNVAKFKELLQLTQNFYKTIGVKVDPLSELDKIFKEQETKIGAKITSAAPKIFNININNLVEEFNVNTTTIKDGAIDIRKAIEQTLAEAIADVQAIAG